LVPACARGRHTDLELFSASSGRTLRRLAPVPLGGYQQLATPATTDHGLLFFTFTSGARCAESGAFMECPSFAPDSCRNTVETLSPGQTELQPLFAVSGAEAIREVVPNPDGGEVAMMITPCVSLHGTTGLFVRDLKTGIIRAVARSANRCDAFGPAAWNRRGTEVVFPLERADGPPMTMAGGIGCPKGRNYLALAPARTAPGPGGLKLIHSERGCIFRAAAFDQIGVVAAEGCDQGDPERGVGGYLGHAFVAQYSLQGRLTARVALRLGLEQAVVATEPNTGKVLITQDQPANEPYPERDWVWEFDGHHLRPIAHYQADDAAQVLAVPW
jgi:hypothetical protein